ncbi:MAG: large conductance mechanosensitive channel protein MscL [Lachnospiraceae bacterium]|nr:large conductance mechanosensitive channel protein MscL [Lachnospiraceae bacterium]
MKNLIEEFKKFISRGNVVDMAVGIIIGGAFTGIVTSLVEDIINPLIGLFGGMNFDRYKLTLLGEATLNYGEFLTAVMNFVIMAFVVFLLVSAINKMSDKVNPKNPADPTTKKCPFCKSEIHLEATRCPHCTSVIEDKQ